MDTKVWGILLIVVFLLGIGIGYMAKPSAAPATTGGVKTVTVTRTITKTAAAGTAPAKPAEQKEYVIGLAIAVTGGYAVDGPRRRNGAILAIEQINKMLEEAGSPVRLKYIHEDTKTSAEGAIAALEKLNSAGVKMVVGPLATSECKAVLDFLKTNKITAISPSSTGTAAMVKGDFCFRAPSPDKYQGPALANIIWQQGIKKLVILARNDDYGKGLADLVEENFKKLGGQVEKIIYDHTQPDLSADVERASNAVNKFGADAETGVLIIAFDDDGIKILEAARLDPTLSKVRWFGPDSMKRATFLPPKSKEDIALFLQKVHFMATTPAVGSKDNPLVKEFIEEYTKKFGESPEASTYTFYAYDAAWIAGLTVLVAHKYDGVAFQKILPVIAKHFYGVTGWKLLDEYGDAAVPIYDIVAPRKQPDGTWNFVPIGKYDGTTKAVTLFEQP